MAPRPARDAPAGDRPPTLALGQAHLTRTPGKIVTVEPGCQVMLVAAVATTIGTSQDIGVMDGFTLPANCPVTFRVRADWEALTFWGVSAMGSGVSYAVTGLEGGDG